MIQICFAAYSEEPEKSVVINAIKVVDNLKRYCSNVVIFVGGYWGLMKNIVDRAIENGFQVVIVSPISGEETDFPEEAIVFKPGVDYRVRSVFMVRSCNALIAVGGESGTIHEIVAAYTEGKPVYVLKSGLSSDRIELLAPHIDRRALSEIKMFSDPEKLVEALANEVCTKNIIKRVSERKRIG
ncbi:hypothetical protein QPL79_02415 [Ignisphaera sp. 4213-co]|uniref:LOG family protein n=1 Tax=Ignisphaera cupida TaxID=3050454 RepID=A0ABD4Z639_9CREN|nr:hypothetical protein [Ignisphaera sp. 4213-co]MDK6028219.1 hypothetical protein [Ignisphaera sp. 4213-co]